MGLEAMIQILPSDSDRNPAPPLTQGEGVAATAELNILLLRCADLTKEVARIRKLVTRLAQDADSLRPGSRSGKERGSARPQSSPDPCPRPAARSTLRRSPTTGRSARPVRSELARACRIAMMEMNEPASAETIYDRIGRRGSFTFAGYKRPLRAIGLAMGAMVKRGEASLLEKGGRPRWRWEADRGLSEAPASFTLA
jgi:hypothetical protein